MHARRPAEWQIELLQLWPDRVSLLDDRIALVLDLWLVEAKLGRRLVGEIGADFVVGLGGELVFVVLEGHRHPFDALWKAC